MIRIWMVAMVVRMVVVVMMVVVRMVMVVMVVVIMVMVVMMVVRYPFWSIEDSSVVSMLEGGANGSSCYRKTNPGV